MTDTSPQQLEGGILTIPNAIAMSAAAMALVLAVVLNAPAAVPAAGAALPLSFLLAFVAAALVGNTVVQVMYALTAGYRLTEPLQMAAFVKDQNPFVTLCQHVSPWLLLLPGEIPGEDRRDRQLRARRKRSSGRAAREQSRPSRRWRMLFSGDRGGGKASVRGCTRTQDDRDCRQIRLH
jgi:hypothetical protein